MLILLYSDTNYVLDGFKSEYSISNCPRNCSSRGKCHNNKCICQGDWIGVDCSLEACVDNCGVAEGRGVCHANSCICQEVKHSIYFL